MKFKRIAGTDGVDTYGRWISEDGRFSVQRFQYHKLRGARDHTRVKPYYRVYDLENMSKGIETTSHLKTWAQVIECCNNYMQGELSNA